MQVSFGGERDTPSNSNGRPVLRLRIEPSERVFICGQAGSGKSYLANILLRGVRADKLIIDIKAMFEHPGSYVTDDVSRISELLRKNGNVTYQPSLPYDWNDINEAFDIAYARGNTTIYNDERGGWARPWNLDLLPSEAHAIMRGRQRNVGVWEGTQRPTHIPIPVMSETDHFFVFRLQHGMDRKKVSEFAGDDIRHVMLPKRHFWYSGPSSDAVMYPPIRVVNKGRRRERRT